MRFRNRYWTFSWVWFGFGFDMMRQMDMQVWLVLFPKLEGKQRGQMVPGFHVGMSWNWLPIIRRFVGSSDQPWAGIYDSKRWTGRDRIINWEWPFVWHCKRVKPT